MLWCYLFISSRYIEYQAEIETSAADLQVADLTVYIGALEAQLINVTKYAESWVRKCEENSTALLELGQSLTWLGQGENLLTGDSLAEVIDFTWHAMTTIGTVLVLSAIIISPSLHENDCFVVAYSAFWCVKSVIRVLRLSFCCDWNDYCSFIIFFTRKSRLKQAVSTLTRTTHEITVTNGLRWGHLVSLTSQSLPWNYCWCCC